MQEQKLNKIRTLLAVLLLAFSIFSLACISLEQNHQCTGDNCQICYVINLAEQNLRLLSLFAASVFISRIIRSIPKECSHESIGNACLAITPVTQKVRMNN